VRIQKSLILDFDLNSAQESALEDWKIDVERELVEKNTPPENDQYFPNLDRTKKEPQI